MTDDGGPQLTVDQALAIVNALEREKRRGKPSRREAAEDAQRPMLAYLREVRADLNFHEDALFWYLGERPVVTYTSMVQSMGGSVSAKGVPQPEEVPRLACAFCGEQTSGDDAASLVYIEVAVVDGSYRHSLGAHVWCLPDDLVDRALRDRRASDDTRE